MDGVIDGSLRNVSPDLKFGVLRRRTNVPMIIACTLIAFLFLILAPILPLNYPYTECCGPDIQSISFKYLGYGFLAGVSFTGRYSVWCHNLDSGFQCYNDFSLGNIRF